MTAKLPEVLITLLVLQIYMPFQKYRGSKHLNLQRSWPTLPRVENPRCQPTNRKYQYLRNYDIYRQNYDKILTAKLWHSTMANSQEVYLGDSSNDRQSEMAAETSTYTSGFDRHLDFHNEWVVGRHSDPFTLPCSKTIMQFLYGNRLCAVDDDLLLLPYCPSSWKCTIIVVYTPRSHFQSPTFNNIASVKFTVVFHRRRSEVAKPEYRYGR